VREVQTAAAVIESFVRDDVGSPLLAIRPVAAAPAPVRAALAEPPPRARPRLPTGWHFFGGLETSFANDGTQWMGMSLGACVMLGPLCAAARLRGGSVVAEHGVWDLADRRSGEILVGLDVPFRLGRFLLTPGVAAGTGDVTTKADAPTSRSSYFRAETHVALSIPLTTSLAVDVYVAGTLAQQVEREPGYMTTIEEPYGYLRFGLGMRYGDR
jgi:hypothetical protein